MASLKEMRNRIGSVKSTQKITKALQMVAAAKLRRSQDAAQNARPYAERMAAVIANLAAGVSGAGAPKLLVGTGGDRSQLIIIATSDRGLAGGFNSSIIRAARERIERLTAEGKSVKLICVGKKSRDALRRQFGGNIVEFIEAGSNPSLAVAQSISDTVQALFAAGDIDVVTLFYSSFKSVVTQTPTAKQLIPAEVVAGAPKIDLKGASYEYEPDEETILQTLLPRNITTQIFSAMLENQAGFFASQMTAMDNATRNAQITKELIEIISGAEAL
jgi:F-type H+-transporting ATPase subunit gamma